MGWLGGLLTYALHALAWAGVAALLVRRRASAAAVRHLCWKAALFGPLLSSLAALRLSPTNAVEPLEHGAIFAVQRRGVAVSALVAAEGRALDTRARHLHALGFLLLAAAGVGGVRFTGSLWFLRRRLRARKPLHEPRVLARLERLRARSCVRRIVLSENSELSGPLVIGTDEISLPLATATALSDAEIDAVLAHELAHLERRDGLWFPAVGLLEAVTWFYPVTRWVAARFRASAELACDDRAVTLTGDPAGLARALVRVAERASSVRHFALAPPMIQSSSALVTRVRRLTRRRESADFDASRGRRRAVVSVGLLGATLAVSSVRLVEARALRSAPAAWNVGTAAPQPRAVVPPPDAAEASRLLAWHLRHEHELESALAALTSLPAAERAGTPVAVRVLELEQALRHTRATELWLERSFEERSGALASPAQ